MTAAKKKKGPSVKRRRYMRTYMRMRRSNQHKAGLCRDCGEPALVVVTAKDKPITRQRCETCLNLQAEAKAEARAS